MGKFLQLLNKSIQKGFTFRFQQAPERGNAVVTVSYGQHHYSQWVDIINLSEWELCAYLNAMMEYLNEEICK